MKKLFSKSSEYAATDPGRHGPCRQARFTRSSNVSGSSQTIELARNISKGLRNANTDARRVTELEPDGQFTWVSRARPAGDRATRRRPSGRRMPCHIVDSLRRHVWPGAGALGSRDHRALRQDGDRWTEESMRRDRTPQASARNHGSKPSASPST